MKAAKANPIQTVEDTGVPSLVRECVAEGASLADTHAKVQESLPGLTPRGRAAVAQYVENHYVKKTVETAPRILDNPESVKDWDWRLLLIFGLLTLIVIVVLTFR